MTSDFTLRSPLRYGENPHQRAAFYVEPAPGGPNLATATVRHGKELSYNNLLDLDMRLRLVRQFAEPAACILKHNNPCGAAIAADPRRPSSAYEGDPVSAFGGIVALNRPVDRADGGADVRPGRFLEAILAPGFDEAALEWLTTKPTWRNSVRLIELARRSAPATAPSGYDLRRIEGGLLVQDWDRLEADPAAGIVPTRRSPTEAERRDLAFAWRVCAAVKSNAIVLARGRPDRGRRCRPDEPARLGQDRRREGRPRARARSWPRTPSSRSATAPTSPRPRALPPSSSPVARDATTRRSRPATSTTSP